MADRRTKAEVSAHVLSRTYNPDTEGEKGFALLSPWRKNPHERGTPAWQTFDEENQRGYRQLLQEVSGAGHRYARLVGYWRDAKGERVLEPLLSVVGMGLEEVLALARAHNLEAFVYVGPETGSRVAVVRADGRVEEKDAFSARAVEAAWREIRGVGPVLEGFLRRPENWIEAIIYHREREVMEGD